MAEQTKNQAAKEAALEDLASLGVAKRGPGRPKGSGKRGPGRPKGVAKRGPGRPKGSGKRGPGRPKGAGKPGRPQSGRKPGRPKAAVSLKGYVKVAQAKRLAKDAVAKFKDKLPGLVRKEIKKLLR